jgi:uncharacterized LabA/DUF88 family protein
MNYAFIDAQNINLSIREQGWKLDWKKFRTHLKEKYHVSKAYIFIGFTPENQALYNFLQSSGFVLIFKPVLHLKSWHTKWNVDAELVLQAMIDYSDYEKWIIISGDGDFACLVRHLYQNKKLEKLIVPNPKRYSKFLNDAAKDRIDDLCNIRKKIEYKKDPHQLSTDT